MNAKEKNAAIKAVTELEGKELANAVGELIEAKSVAETALETLTEEHNKCTEEKEALKVKADQADALSTQVEELTAQLEAAKEDPNALKRCNKTFTVEGKTYGFKTGTLKVRIAGYKEPVTADEIAEDKTLQARLVKIGYAGIEEVPTKK